MYSMKPYNTNHSKFPKKKLQSYCLVSNILKENYDRNQHKQNEGITKSTEPKSLKTMNDY